MAAKVGCGALAATLLGAGASVHHCTEYGQTPLHVAAGEGHAVVVLALLEYGADLDAMTKVYTVIWIFTLTTTPTCLYMLNISMQEYIQAGLWQEITFPGF